jgi:hypothetical protein
MTSEGVRPIIGAIGRTRGIIEWFLPPSTFILQSMVPEFKSQKKGLGARFMKMLFYVSLSFFCCGGGDWKETFAKGCPHGTHHFIPLILSSCLPAVIASNRKLQYIASAGIFPGHVLQD